MTQPFPTALSPHQRKRSALDRMSDARALPVLLTSEASGVAQSAALWVGLFRALALPSGLSLGLLLERLRADFVALEEHAGASIIEAALSKSSDAPAQAVTSWPQVAAHIAPRLTTFPLQQRYVICVAVACGLASSDELASLRFATDALLLARQLDDPARIALSLHHIAHIHLAAGSFSQAQSLFQDASLLAERHQLSLLQCITPPMLALACLALPDEALADNVMALWLARHSELPCGFEALPGFIVAARLAAQRPALWQAAQKWLAKAEALLGQSTDAAVSACYRVQLAWARGVLLRWQGDLPGAIASLSLATPDLEACQSAFIQTDARHDLYECLQLQGDTAAALTVHIEFAARQASLLRRGHALREQSLALDQALAAEREARQQAEAQTEQMAECLAVLSHGIDNPLGAIVQLSRLALQGELNAQQDDYLSHIFGAGQFLQQLASAIVDFSSLEAGRLSLQNIPFTLDDVISHLVRDTKSVAAARRITYLCSIPPALPQVCGDPLRLGQTLLHLVNHAIASVADNASITLHLHIASEQAKVVTVLFAVRFKPQRQDDDSVGRLRLAIVRQLLELLGAQLDLRTTSRGLCECQFVLPLTPHLATRSPSLPPALQHARLLLLNHHIEARQSLVQSVVGLPLQLDTVGSTQSALAALQSASGESAYQILLSDDARFIRHLHKDANIAALPPCVLISSADAATAQAEAAAAGADAWLCQPVRLADLCKCLDPLISQRMVENAASTTDASDYLCYPGARILLAEDNPINQQIAAELLQMAKISVEIAHNGQQAWTMLQDRGPDFYDLILMDLQMPVMDGHEATLAIRNDANFDHIPIVALTAHAIGDVKQRCIREGMQDYLTKPIHPEQLTELLGRYLVNPAAALLPKPISDEDIDLSHLSGLDMAQGLIYMAGQRGLYVQLLRHFRQAYSDFSGKLCVMLQQADFANAEREVHTLKGVAGSMGATALQAYAEALETELAQRSTTSAPNVAALYGHVDSAINKLLVQLTELFPATTPSHAANTTPQRRVLDEFADLLWSFSFKAVDYLPAHQATLANFFSQSQFELLSQHVSNLAFSDAAALVKAAQERN